jgi:hypothetical protein
MQVVDIKLMYRISVAHSATFTVHQQIKTLTDFAEEYSTFFSSRTKSKVRPHF